MNVIQTRRRQLLLHEVREHQVIGDGKSEIKKRMALLDLLLNTKINGAPLTDEDIREEVDNFMFAVSFF